MDARSAFPVSEYLLKSYELAKTEILQDVRRRAQGGADMRGKMSGGYQIPVTR